MAGDGPPVIVLPSPMRPSRGASQITFQSPRQKPPSVADEIAVEIVGVVLLFNERSIDENLGDSDSVQFRSQDGQILNELSAPRSVSVPRAFPAWGATHQAGRRQLAECQVVIPDRQQPVRVERGESPASSGHL